MKRIAKSYTSAAAGLTAFASNVTGGTWTLSANSVSGGGGLAYKVTIRNDSSTDHTGKTITLTGTGPEGQSQTETLAGPNNAATVTSTKYYLTLTSVTVDATIGADTFDIGNSAAAATPAVFVGRIYDKSPALGISVDATGTPAYSLQQSYGGTDWYAHASIATKTASADGSLLFPVTALRLVFTAASTVTLNVVAM